MRRLIALLFVMPLLACADPPTAPADGTSDDPAMLLALVYSQFDFYRKGESQPYAGLTAAGVEEVEVTFAGKSALFRAGGVDVETPHGVSGMTVLLDDNGLAALRWNSAKYGLTDFLPQAARGHLDFDIEAMKLRAVRILDAVGARDLDAALFKEAVLLHHSAGS